MTTMQHDEQLECINNGGEDQCQGPVEYRHPLSASGRPFPRCDKHWADRLDLEHGLQERYPVSPPADWSPLDAGEAWDESDY